MLEGRDIDFAYPGRDPVLSGATLSVAPGEIVGLTGRSGSGKSTLARLLAGYLRPERGLITTDGRRVRDRSPVQYVHQSSIASVNPRWTIGRIIEEAWSPDAQDCAALGVSRRWFDRYPHEVSGGELQRVTLLRALAPGVRYLIADEVTAMLDPLTQAEIWQALRERCRHGLGILAISHDDILLNRVSDRTLELAAARLATPSTATEVTTAALA